MVLSFDLAAAGITYAAHPTLKLEAVGLISPLKDPLGDPDKATFLSANFSTTQAIQFCYRTTINPLTCAQFPKTVTNNVVVTDVTDGIPLGNDNESFNVLIDPPGRCLLPAIDVQKTVYNGHDGGASCPGSENATVTSTSKNVTWCFVVKNTGTSYLNGVSVSDPSLPGSPFTNPTLLAPNASVTIFKEGVQGATLTNTSSATGPATDSTGTVLAGTPAIVPSTNTATVTLANPALTLAKTAILGPNGDCTLANDSLPTVANGATVTYCFKVTNAGDTNLINVSLVDSQVPYSTIIGNLAIGASVTKSIDSVRTTNLVNSATVTGTPATAANVAFPGVVDITATDTTTVNVSAPLITDPQITKSTAGVTPRLAGDIIISTIVLSNPAPVATTTAVGLSFTDPIPATPAGTIRTYTSVVTGGATGNTASGSGGISDTVTLPVNSTITYTINDTVTSTGNYQNSATLQGKPPVTGQAIVVNAPAISATKSTPAGPYLAGSVITSTVTVQNTGSSTGTALVVDPIPAAPAGTTRTYTSVSTGGATGASASGTTGINETVTLPPTGKVVYTINDTPIVAGTYQNNVTINGGSPIPGNVPGPVIAPNVNMTKSTPLGPYTVGVPIVSTVVVSNTGGATGTAQILNDPVPTAPAGTTRTFTSLSTGGATGATASGTGTINDTLTLPAGSTVVYTINDTPVVAGTYQNNAKLNGGPDVPGNIPGVVNAPSVGITKTTPAGPYLVGQVITSTVTVQNTGTSSGTALVQDAIPVTPAGTTRTYTSVSTGGATGASASGTSNINETVTLPAGGKVVYTVNDTPTQSGLGVNGYQNSVILNSGTPVTGNAKFDVTAPNVSLTKTTPLGPYTVGTAIVSSLTVQNTGTSGTSTLVADPIPATPAGTTRSYTSVSTGGATGASASGTTSISETVTLPAGGKVVYTISDTPIAAGTYQNNATKDGGPNVPGNVPGVVNAPSIGMTKTTPPGPYTVGTPIVSTLSVNNTGGASGTAIIADPIPVAPAGTTRTFTTTITGGATGATASGTGAIADTLTMPGPSSVIYTISDTPTQPGTYQNNAKINNGTDVPGGPPGTVQAPNIGSTKTTNAGPYIAGTPITSTVTVQNTGSSVGTAVVSDPIPALPAGTTRTYTSVSTGGATGATASGTLGINDNLTLPPTGKVVYTVIDTPIVAGTYQNIATVNGTQVPGPSGPVNAPDIKIKKDTTPPSGPYSVNVPITSTVTVTNSGTSTGTTNVVDNIPLLPVGTTRTFTSAPSGGATGATVSGTGNINDNLTMPAGSSVIYTVNDTPTQAGTYQNSATITGKPPVTGGPGGPVNAPNINTTKSTPVGPYIAGNVITSTITITNTGLAAGPATVSDPIPATPVGTTRTYTSVSTGGATGATASGSAAITDTLTMPAASKVVYTVNDTPTQAGTYQNNVIVNSTTYPGGPPGIVNAPNITSTKTTPTGPYNAGTPITSQIVVSNIGGATGTTTVVDIIPATPLGTTRTFTSNSPSGATGNTLSGTGNINDTLSMPAGSIVIYIVNDTPVLGGNYQNTVVVGGVPKTGRPTPEHVKAPLINITKSTPPGPYTTGFPIVSTITVTNTGDLVGTTNLVDNVLSTPAGITRTFVSVSGGGATGNTSGTGNINDNLTLPATSGTVTYTVKDIPTISGNYQNNATITTGIPPVVQPPVPGNTPAPIIDIKKDTAAGPYSIGTPIVSTITLKNLGTITANGVTVVDPIPATPSGIIRSFTSTVTGGVTGATSGPLTTGINDTLIMPAGSTAVYTVSDTPTQSGDYQNLVTVNGNQIPGTPGGIPPGTGVPVPKYPVIDIVKKTPLGPYSVGSSITSTITVKNLGTVTGTGVTVVDPIPASPAGTVRSFVSLASGGASGNTLTSNTGINDTLTMPAGSTVVYTVIDIPTKTGDYQNFVTVAGGNKIPGTPNPLPPGNPTPPPGGVVDITKDTPKGPFVVGTPIVSTITVFNGSSVAVTGVLVKDPIPATPVGTVRSFTSTSTGGAIGATATGTTSINDSLTMPAGSKVVYKVSDTPIASGPYQNFVTIGNGSPTPGDPGGKPIPPGGPVPPAEPVINIIKDTPAGPYTTGTAIVSKVTVENTSGLNATGVSFVDPIPATPSGTIRSFTSLASGGASGNTLSGTTNINDTLSLPTGSKVVYMISDTPTKSGDYQNFVTVAGGNPTPGTPGGVPIPPGGNVPPPGAVIGVVKKTPAGPYALGTAIVSTITVTNDSTQTANGVTMVDPIPATPPGTVRSYTSLASGGVTGNSLTGTAGISDTLKMPPSSNVVYTISDTPIVGGNYQNWVTVNDKDPIPGTPKPIDPGTPPPPPSPVIDIKKFTPDGPYNAGVPITSTITVSNLGTVTATGVSVVDNLPTEPAGNTRTFTSVATGGASGNSLNGTSSINDTLTMPAGSKVIYTVNDTAHVAGTYQNFVVVLGGNKIPGTPNPLPPGAPTPPPGDVHAPNIEVTKDTPAGPYEAGTSIPTKLTIKNTGNSDATKINLTDLVPTQPPGNTRTFTSAASGGATGNTVTGSGDVKDILNLPIGSSVVYNIQDTPHMSGTYQNKANVQCDCDVPGAPGEKGRDILGTPGGIPPKDGEVSPPGIVNSAKIVTTKDTPAGPYTVGKPITSKITISNIGNATGKEIHVDDPIPANPAGTTRTFTSTMSGNATGNTASGTGNISDVLTIPAGEVVIYLVNDTPTKAGDYKNIVTISSPTDIPGAPKGGMSITGTPGGIGSAGNSTVVSKTLPNTGNGLLIYFVLAMMMMGSLVLTKRRFGKIY